MAGAGLTFKSGVRRFAGPPANPTAPEPFRPTSSAIWRALFSRQQGAEASLVAPVGSPATCSEEAELQRGLVEENVGVVGHQGLPDTTFALVGNTSKSKVLMSQLLTIKKFVPPERLRGTVHMT